MTTPKKWRVVLSSGEVIMGISDADLLVTEGGVLDVRESHNGEFLRERLFPAGVWVEAIRE